MSELRREEGEVPPACARLGTPLRPSRPQPSSSGAVPLLFLGGQSPRVSRFALPVRLYAIASSFESPCPSRPPSPPRHSASPRHARPSACPATRERQDPARCDTRGPPSFPRSRTVLSRCCARWAAAVSRAARLWGLKEGRKRGSLSWGGCRTLAADGKPADDWPACGTQASCVTCVSERNVWRGC